MNKCVPRPPGWLEAPEHFDASFDGENAAELRALGKAVVMNTLRATRQTAE